MEYRDISLNNDSKHQFKIKRGSFTLSTTWSSDLVNITNNIIAVKNGNINYYLITYKYYLTQNGF